MSNFETLAKQYVLVGLFVAFYLHGVSHGRGDRDALKNLFSFVIVTAAWPVIVLLAVLRLGGRP